jgi:hypothetical protein
VTIWWQSPQPLDFLRHEELNAFRKIVPLVFYTRGFRRATTKLSKYENRTKQQERGEEDK